MQIEIIYLATFVMKSLDFIFRRSTSRILKKKMTSHPIKFCCEKREGHSKRDRMEIIDRYLKPVFAG